MTPYLILITVTAFIAVGAATGSVVWLVIDRNAPERQRVRAVVQGATTTGIVATQPRLAESVDPTLARLSRLMPKSPKEMSRLQRRLTRAGYPQAKAAVYFCIAQLMLPLLFGLAVLVVLGLGAGLFAVLGALVGYLLPTFYIARQTKLRQKALQNGLPDALDLLTVCVEAGSGLDQAIVRASEELALVHPALADELKTVTTETRAGKPRIEAFKNFSHRTGVEDVRTLVAMLTQTDRFGTSVAQALRTHADTSRTKRRQRAEERAAKVGVKLVFPLALCLFPALYVVCFGPVVVAIYRAFFS